MQPELFQSKDSKISVSDSEITFKKVVLENNENYWLHSFLLFCILLYMNISDLQQGAREVSALLWSIILVVWTFPHLEKIFTYLFFEKWGSKILIHKIVKIQILEPKNEFEREVKIWVKSKRRKLITFRTAEGQLDKFLEAIKSRHPLHSSAISLKAV
jgi:hypothetical protein